MLINKIKTTLLRSCVPAIVISVSFIAFNSSIEAGDKDTSENKVMHKNISEGWVRPSDEELKKTLTKIQFEVTRKDGTERPFKNEYWDNKAEGIYVDIVSGEPLFSSKDKFKSGTGWPSFTKPLVLSNIVEKEDNSLFARRIEVRSKHGDSHLGHVFNDGPRDKGGLRYCMNSASMKFIPKSELEKLGYKEFASQF